jgi:predicted site-specific integrase-resolvase
MKKPDVIPDELYTVPETCKALGINRRTLRRYTNAGAIACHIRNADNRIVYLGADIFKCYYSVT